jgi:hypothetical protein
LNVEVDTLQEIAPVANKTQAARGNESGSIYRTELLAM